MFLLTNGTNNRLLYETNGVIGPMNENEKIPMFRVLEPVLDSALCIFSMKALDNLRVHVVLVLSVICPSGFASMHHFIVVTFA